MSDTVYRVLVPPDGSCTRLLSTRFVELQACLDKPYGVGGRSRHNPGIDRRANMDPSGFLPVIEIVADDALAVSISIEVDCSSRDDARQVWTKPLEKSAPTFDFVYGEEYLECLGEM